MSERDINKIKNFLSDKITVDKGVSRSRNLTQDEAIIYSVNLGMICFGVRKESFDAHKYKDNIVNSLVGLYADLLEINKEDDRRLALHNSDLEPIKNTKVSLLP